MTELEDRAGATYERLNMQNSRFTWVDLEGSEFRDVGLQRIRMRGVELAHAQIDGELLDVVVNGVDVAPLVEAELVRRDPDYARMKPADAAGFRDAWRILERRWDEMVARARTLEPELLHARVDDEWSFIETLRHLCYATDAWVQRVYLGDPDPWSPLDLPFTTLLDLEWAYDEDVRPSLEEVLALRADRQATVRRVIGELTDERLAEKTTPVDGPGWPPADSYDVSEALRIVVNEEWHHMRYADRDLAALESRT